MRSRLAFALATSFGVPASAEAPLSAIEWLSDSVMMPQVAVSAPPAIDVAPLKGLRPAIGMRDPEAAGLPDNLWSGSRSEDVARLLERLPKDLSPPLADLIARVLSVAADPPEDDSGAFLLARIDRLMAMARLEDALALIEAGEQVDDADPELFRRQFDIQLLTGTEDLGCRELDRRPGISPTYPARIFCLARGGDWPAASLTLESADILGALEEGENAILARFLEDGFEDILPPPSHRAEAATPLTLRIFEAIGEPLPTQNLPLPFAHAELRANVGWKARLVAAERLARAGALRGPDLVQLYDERAPAASGGVWARVSAVQAVLEALEMRDDERLKIVLPDAAVSMRRAGLLFALAEAVGAQLVDLLPDEDLARELAGLVQTGSADAPMPVVRTAQTDAALRGAIGTGWTASASDGAKMLIDSGRAGEVILAAVDTIAQGSGADPEDLAEALGALRYLGLHEPAHQAALLLLVGSA